MWRGMIWPQRRRSHFVFLHSGETKRTDSKHLYQLQFPCSFMMSPELPRIPGLVDSWINREGICQVRTKKIVDLRILPRTAK